MSQVQSVRGVGCVKGFPYYAYGLYESRYSPRNKKWTYRLVASGPRFRSDVHGRTRFAGVPVVDGVRHGTPAPPSLEVERWRPHGVTPSRLREREELDEYDDGSGDQNPVCS